MTDMHPRTRPRVLVDPLMVTMAVRYCLGERHHPPVLADEVRAVADRLGEQRQIIMSDIADWLLDDTEQRRVVTPDHAGDTDMLRAMWVQLLADLGDAGPFDE